LVDETDDFMFTWAKYTFNDGVDMKSALHDISHYRCYEPDIFLELLLDFVLVKDIWYFWHPFSTILAKEFSLGRELVWIVKGSPHDVPKLVRSLLAIFANESTTVIAKFSNDTVFLFERLWFPFIVTESLERDLCSQTKVGAKCSFTAPTVAQRCSCIIRRV
jgi:hypothetical protein